MFFVRFGFGGFRWCSLSRVGDTVAIDEGGDSVEARAVLTRAAAMAETVLAAVVGSAWAVSSGGTELK